MSTPHARGSINSVLKFPGPYTDPEYDFEYGKSQLKDAKILVLGAGGLGCEILKDLAFSGVKQLSIIDMDRIELSNLNRQFLFTESTVDHPKSIVASNAMLRTVKNLKIDPYFHQIEDFDIRFYKQFTIIICGLDSIDARRWISEELVNIAMYYGKIIPMVDGGSEGFKGSVKVIVPTVTACFECYVPLIPGRKSYPLCTLASSPRLPEHCIQWAHQLQWQKAYPGEKFDADNREHIDKLYELALSRAEEYKIDGVTREKTAGVVKNIVPAIASTNSIVAAKCANEAIKFVTSCAPSMKDSLFYNGERGVLDDTFKYHKLPECPVCGQSIQEINFANDTSIDVLARFIKNKYNLVNPVLLLGDKEIYNFKFRDNKYARDKVSRLIGNVAINVIDKTVTNKLIIRIIIGKKSGK